jgi:chitin disaccharide deacetylase
MSLFAGRRLIINADDFGRDAAANKAIADAYDRGCLSTTSLMVNEPAAAEAVKLAKERPGLGVGLHLTLVYGHAASTHQQAPNLVDEMGQLSYNAPAAGMRYFFNSKAREELRSEIGKQFQKFKETGLPLDHVNGHLHLHLHPTVASILLTGAADWDIHAMRLTRDPFWLSWKLGRGPLFYRLSHALIFNLLSLRVTKRICRMGIRHTDRVFGLLQTSHVHEEYLLKLLDNLPAGDSELYSHPSVEPKYQAEYQALIAPKILQRLKFLNLTPIRYADL